ncbi:amidase [Actinomadura sp. 9N407]|uniref:amidase n=1 Tax=Actinomadura sp. 9N407 TaxID=3375154 RepID=UPI00378C5145
MNADDIAWAQATELRDLLVAGDVSVVEVATVFADRIEALNPQLNAYVYFDRSTVLADAAELDARRERGENLGPLHGVPYSIKCLTDVAGLPGTLALKPFADRVAERDEVVVRRMREAGGLFLGLTNAPEAGYYGGTNSHLYGPTHNPWAHDQTAGGSSGGAAAAVAAGLSPLSQGTDGGGSVRIPASLCGVVGFKPSLGRIPQRITLSRAATNLFHGPLTRTVDDAALMYDVVTGPDSSDFLSLPAEAPIASAIRPTPERLRIAYSPDLGTGYHIDPEVASVARAAAEAFSELGASVVEATPPWHDLEKVMWEGVWVPGYAGLHDAADWRSLRGEVDDNLIELVLASEKLTEVDFGRADVGRGMAYDTFDTFMQDFDLLLSPTLTSAAFPLSQFAPSWVGPSVREQILGWLLTYPFNMLPMPAISVPAGFTSDGRPVGLQIAGRHLADATVLAAARAFETARPWQQHRPQMAV